MTLHLADPDTLYRVAAALFHAARDVLTEHGLRVPDAGGVSHKGGDYECENCESLWVWLEGTLPVNLVTGPDGSCSSPLTRQFVVELAYPSCTEGLEPCSSRKHFPERDDGDCGCVTVDPKLGSGNCGDGDRPTVLQETQYVWRARYVLETLLACEAQCCVEECANIRCKSTTLESATETTEGGCTFLTFRVNVTW